jgi:hypothetical protein
MFDRLTLLGSIVSFYPCGRLLTGFSGCDSNAIKDFSFLHWASFGFQIRRSKVRSKQLVSKLESWVRVAGASC